MTAGERRALTWLLAVTAAGAGVRVLRHWRDRGDATPATAEALSRQLLAVDSAQRAGRGRARRSGAAGSRRGLGSGSLAAATGPDSGRARRRRSRVLSPDSSVERPTLVVVDVDVADSATLERLPKIGPALAQRIVSDRAVKGAFGSLRGLERVRGIGPKLAAGLASRVTFSGNPRPLPVQR